MTAQTATSTQNLPPRAHAITMATLVTETAVVIGSTDVRPVSIAVREMCAGPYPWQVEVQVDIPADVDELGRVFALPVIEWAPTLHTRAWDGVSLAGDLVSVRVYSGRWATTDGGAR